MLWVTITGVKPYDGRYEFDVGSGEFSTREWGWIKRHAGYLPLTIDQGWEGGDPELFAVFALIGLHRAGKITAKEASEVFDRIADAPFGSTIGVENDQPDEDEGVEDGPPPRSSPANTPSSGDDSPVSSAPSTPTPSGSGTPDSDGAASTPIRLAT